MFCDICLVSGGGWVIVMGERERGACLCVCVCVGCLMRGEKWCVEEMEKEEAANKKVIIAAAGGFYGGVEGRDYAGYTHAHRNRRSCESARTLKRNKETHTHTHTEVDKDAWVLAL